LLSEKTVRLARTLWEKALPSFGGARGALERELARAEGDERTLLALACATLPTADLGAVPPETLRSYAAHACELRGHSPYCRDLPEDIFLHFVFYPRVNNEDLTPCRPFFHALLRDRLDGLDTCGAVLEVNRWCAENMTYQASNDRTESPIAAYNGGLGRCGEESTFTVSALRSVGIAARQIYAPLWAHCDDNHAWVEAYIDGQWRFFGACEPEPALDRGWFTDAASRAPLVCWRTFFDYPGEEPVERQGAARLYSVTGRYAETAPLEIRVVDESGAPVPGARLEVDILNMSALRPLLTRTAGERGECCLCLGRGTVHVEAWDGARGARGEAKVGAGRVLKLTLREGTPAGVRAADFAAPKSSSKNRSVLTAEQEEAHGRAVAACARLRERRFKGYFLPEYRCGDRRWETVFRLAGGNAPALYAFYQARNEAERPLALTMLRALPAKDYRDVSLETLEGCFAAAQGLNPETPHFEDALLNLRIENEALENWRPALLAAFSPEEQARFRKDPPAFLACLNERFPEGDGRFYPALAMSPCAVLRTGCADEAARRRLFTAGMRAFGVPARLNPSDGACEYWRDGWQRPETSVSCALRLRPEEGRRFVYGNSLSLARRDGDGVFRTLRLRDAELKKSVPLPPGVYRVTTAARLPNGNQQAWFRTLTLEPGDRLELTVHAREPSPEEVLGDNRLDPFHLRDQDGAALFSETLLSGKRLLIFLDVGKEPSEHILNELIEAVPSLEQPDAPGVILVLRRSKDAGNPTFRRALAALPNVTVCYDDFGPTAEMLAKKLSLEPGVWPLLVLTDETMLGRYGSCGYRVGVVAYALRLAELF